ncbi:hypothetical protein AVEN_38024-1 [Araneus ventricosus]|uniref:Uncharacterized protein n=1 Tax=Araneus ventricosus TaxID=182803 RepID=A0A4Y2URV2_ARAVE|nr:hypothetical protein AVEN_38024-1 [Araneus ventricosus]
MLARWQACRGTVQDGGNPGEEFLYVGICEVFFGYERSAYANIEKLHLVICSMYQKLAPLKPGVFGRKRHELDSPKLCGHLPYQNIPPLPQKKPTASD